MKIRTAAGVVLAIASLSIVAAADEGLSNNRSIDPQGGPLPVTAPVPGPMPEDKQLPSRAVVNPEEKNPVISSDPNAADDQKALKKVEARLKAGGLTDKQRFHLQLRRDQLKTKLEGPH